MILWPPDARAVTRATRRPKHPLWYKDAVIYEVPVRSFFDSNGDGVGDFPGLIAKLDYVAELGVTCLWLLPFFPSPLKDDGYDISDYRAIHPSFGTLDDFKQFLAAAHERNLDVIIELVVNHTSDQHAWFERARNAPAGSAERDFYVWSNTDQQYRDARIIFVDTETSNWTRDPVAQAYYWHRFFQHQPDLNYDNPAVLLEILQVMDFWLEMGVDGFRLDAVPYLIERDGTSCENLPETHAVVKAIRRHIDERWPDCMLLAEANQAPAAVRAYFGDGDECHMAYHFPLMPRLFMALHLEERDPVVDVMDQTPAIPETCQWALFLRNHDELTLEMVTDDERDYMYLAYGADPLGRLNVGLRRRLAPLMNNSRHRLELLTSVLFSFPGTPILYYGDEIAMGDNVHLGDRAGVRTPMQWSSDRNAGFSRADPQRLYSPVIMDPVFGYQAVNVEAEQRDPASFLHWTRNLVRLRKLFTVFGRGTIEFLQPANTKILVYLRRYQEDAILCVANLARSVQPVHMDLSAFEGLVPVEMLGYTEFPEIGREPYFLSVGPYGFYWFELQRRSR
jgi:maltose alpha-D-glucosyltransferase/alpha-amylase